MGLMKQIYKTFDTYIKQNLPEIKSFDFYANQLNKDRNGYTDGLSNPRIFLDIDTLNFQSYLGHNQVATANIDLYVCIDILNSFNSKYPKNDTYLNQLDLLDRIFKVLNGMSSAVLNQPDSLVAIHNIKRTKIESVALNGDIKMYRIRFEAIVDDLTGLVDAPIEDYIDEVNITYPFIKITEEL